MATQWQKFSISLAKRYTASERQAIADEVITFIRDRVQNDGLDKRNRPLPGYSEAYVKSLAFKIAGKSKGDVNLTASGDMMGSLTLLDNKKGEITIGFEKGSNENAIADGNIRGTYGHSKPTGPRRDFLGLTKGDLTRILTDFPLDDEETRSRNTDIASSARKASGDTETEDV